MFKNKGVKIGEKPFVVEAKVANPSVHMVDVNMAITKSFKDREPIKKKSTIDLEKEQRL